MKILLMPNFDKENAEKNSKLIIDKLNSLSIEVLMGEQNKARFSYENVCYMEFYAALSQSDAIIAVGGDGTILHSARHALEQDKPLLGINAGRLGYMAGLEIAELDMLEKLKGDYNIQKRMALCCTHKNAEGSHNYIALNDIVVSNGALAKMVDVDIFCSDQKIMALRADGVIFATPTGSTAYSLSAGGPIIDPEIDCVSITPICPHSFFNKTLVFSHENRFKVKNSPLNKYNVYMTADGADGVELLNGDELLVETDKKKLKLIKLNDKSFYRILSEKFSMQ